MTELGLIFAKTLLIGFTVAMLPGLIGILCIQQTLVNGLWAGMVVGLGASTADGIFGAIAGMGLTLVTEVLLHHQFVLSLLGGLFLCYLGIRMVLTKSPQAMSPQQHPALHQPRLLRLYTSIVLLTLANPVTILSFSALLAGASIMPQPHYNIITFAILLFTGFFVGSLVWWVILTSCLTLLKSRITHTMMDTMNMVAGILITLFGLGAIIQAWVR